MAATRKALVKNAKKNSAVGTRKKTNRPERAR